MHEPGDQVIVADNGLAVAPGLHTLFDVGYTVVSNKKYFDFQCFFTNLSKTVLLKLPDCNPRTFVFIYLFS